MSRHSEPQVEHKLAAAQAELDVAKHEVATRDQTSAESKSQAEASAARLQVEVALIVVFEVHDVVLAVSGAAAGERTGRSAKKGFGGASVQSGVRRTQRRGAIEIRQRDQGEERGAVGS